MCLMISLENFNGSFQVLLQNKGNIKKKSPGSDYNFKFNSRLTLLLRSAARPLLCSVPLLLFSASLPLCLHV